MNEDLFDLMCKCHVGLQHLEGSYDWLPRIQNSCNECQAKHLQMPRIQIGHFRHKTTASDLSLRLPQKHQDGWQTHSLSFLACSSPVRSWSVINSSLTTSPQFGNKQKKKKNKLSNMLSLIRTINVITACDYPKAEQFFGSTNNFHRPSRGSTSGGGFLSSDLRDCHEILATIQWLNKVSITKKMLKHT